MKNSGIISKAKAPHKVLVTAWQLWRVKIRINSSLIQFHMHFKVGLIRCVTFIRYTLGLKSCSLTSQKKKRIGGKFPWAIFFLNLMIQIIYLIKVTHIKLRVHRANL